MKGEFINLCYEESAEEVAVLDLTHDKSSKFKIEEKKWADFKKTGIQSIDCGAETVATYAWDNFVSFMHGTAGRMIVDDIQVVSPAANYYI